MSLHERGLLQVLLTSMLLLLLHKYRSQVDDGPKAKGRGGEVTAAEAAPEREKGSKGGNSTEDGGLQSARLQAKRHT